jgi:hypothetical protein
MRLRLVLLAVVVELLGCRTPDPAPTTTTSPEASTVPTVARASMGTAADCAKSEECKTAGRCAFWDQTCMKSADRDLERAKGAAAQADRDAKAAGLTEMVSKWFSGFDVGTVKELSGSPAIDAAWKLESPDPEFVSLERGTATTKGRRLPAYVTSARFKVWNRDAGQRLKVCVTFAAVDDKEFKTWREVQHFKCDDTDGVAAWKKDEEFATSR